MGERSADDQDVYAETEVLDSDAMPDHDADATVVLGEDYRREIEADSKEDPDGM